ncbi:MAG: hypothetical protein R2766_10185 [Saprospiraceae bacterium]
MSPNPTCLGQNATVTFSFSGGQEPYSIEWTQEILNNIPNNYQISVSPGSSQTYEIFSTTDDNGCSATINSSSQATLIVNPNATIIATSINLCEVKISVLHNWIYMNNGSSTSTIDWNWSGPNGLFQHCKIL